MPPAGACRSRRTSSRSSRRARTLRSAGAPPPPFCEPWRKVIAGTHLGAVLHQRERLGEVGRVDAEHLLVTSVGGTTQVRPALVACATPEVHLPGSGRPCGRWCCCRGAVRGLDEDLIGLDERARRRSSVQDARRVGAHRVRAHALGPLLAVDLLLPQEARLRVLTLGAGGRRRWRRSRCRRAAAGCCRRSRCRWRCSDRRRRRAAAARALFLRLDRRRRSSW